MKYILIILLFISTITFAQTCDTTIECSGNVKTTTIVFENDTLFHMDQKDSLVHEVIIEKIIEVSKDVYHSVKQKDYGRVICGLLILCFVGYSVYVKRKKCK
tara:strand:+ start:445 stop:750 length:306 start_codon:yes stop_codon:yes gene_type:complete